MMPYSSPPHGAPRPESGGHRADGVGQDEVVHPAVPDPGTPENPRWRAGDPADGDPNSAEQHTSQLPRRPDAGRFPYPAPQAPPVHEPQPAAAATNPRPGPAPTSRRPIATTARTPLRCRPQPTIASRPATNRTRRATNRSRAIRNRRAIMSRRATRNRPATSSRPGAATCRRTASRSRSRTSPAPQPRRPHQRRPRPLGRRRSIRQLIRQLIRKRAFPRHRNPDRAS